VKPLINIVIPTYNRSKCVALFLKKIQETDLEDLSLCRIDYYDSSENEDTASLFVELPAKLKGVVFYHRLPSSLDTDDKLITAFHAVQTPYCYLLGDGYLLDFSLLKETFLKRREQGDDVMLLAPAANGSYRAFIEKKGYRGDEPLVYTDSRRFFDDFYWLVILYGATIIKKEILDNLFDNKLEERYRHCNFAYPSYIFEYAAAHPMKSSVLLSEAIYYNPEKKEGGWENKNVALFIWSKQLCRAFDLLPAYYAASKEKTLMQVGQDTGFYTPKGLLYMRAKKLISFSLVKRYKPELKRTVKPFGFLLFACLLPSWPFRILVNWRAKRRIRAQAARI
jgi:hypothetical protein